MILDNMGRNLVLDEKTAGYNDEQWKGEVNKVLNMLLHTVNVQHQQITALHEQMIELLKWLDSEETPKDEK